MKLLSMLTIVLNSIMLIWLVDLNNDIDKLTDRIAVIEDINKIEYL